MSYKFPSGTLDVSSFYELATAIESPEGQRLFVEFLNSVAFKGDAQVILMNDITSASYAGAAGKKLQVLQSENALRFASVSGGSAGNRVLVKRTTAQSIATATNTLVTWEAEDFDYGEFWTSGTAITIPADGEYRFVATIYMSGAVLSAERTYWARIVKDPAGSPSYLSTSAESISSACIATAGGWSFNTASWTLTTSDSCSAGDTYAVEVYQNSGVSILLQGPVNYSTFDVWQIG